MKILLGMFIGSMSTISVLLAGMIYSMTEKKIKTTETVNEYIKKYRELIEEGEYETADSYIDGIESVINDK